MVAKTPDRIHTEGVEIEEGQTSLVAVRFVKASKGAPEVLTQLPLQSL